MRRRTVGALAVPVIAIIAIVIATQVFSTGGTTTPTPNSAAADQNAAQTTPDADANANGEAGKEPDAAANDEQEQEHSAKWGTGDPDAAQEHGDADSQEATPGEGPLGGFEAYLAAQRSYPAAEVPPTLPATAQSTFEKIAKQDAASGDPKAKGHKFELYGPTVNATQPGVTAFSGATNNTASRVTAILVAPDCGQGKGADCRIWVGVSGGGVWRTE